MAVINQFILCIFDDAKNFFDSAIHIHTHSTDEYNIDGVGVGVLTDFDRKSFVFSDYSIEII